MNRLETYAAIWITLAFVALYYLLYYAVGFQTSKFIADMAVLVGSTFMSVATAQEALSAIRRGAPSGGDRFLVSFWLMWTFLLVQRVWIIILDVSDRPIWLVESPTSGLISMFIAIAAGYGMAAPLSGPEALPWRQTLMMVVAGVVSGGVVGVVITIYALRGWVM